MMAFHQPGGPERILAEAEELARLGYARAAAMTARILLERCLQDLARRHGCKGRESLSGYVDSLHKWGVLDARQCRRLKRLARAANAAAHGSPFAIELVELLSGAAELFRACFEGVPVAAPSLPTEKLR